MKLLRCLYYMCPIAAMVSCHEQASKADKAINRVIIVQPFSGISTLLVQIICDSLKKINANTILRKPVLLPASAYYKPGGRYKADSIIHYLQTFAGSNTVVIGLTDKDISRTKGKSADWGIMGLGFCPGNACVISAFRLTKADLSKQFYKVALHEIGHTQGLPHCSITTCFMRDAAGGNHLQEETSFCASCKLFLQTKGWHLNE